MSKQKTKHVSGEFEVKLTPQAMHDHADAKSLGRFLLEKEFRGALSAISKGEMISAGTPTEGSAAYSAIEHVVGALEGRRGSFALQHTGIMTRGAPQLTITVVPDSGTDQLVGLAGSMNIVITDGKHFYEFDYTIDAS